MQNTHINAIWVNCSPSKKKGPRNTHFYIISEVYQTLNLLPYYVDIPENTHTPTHLHVGGRNYKKYNNHAVP